MTIDLNRTHAGTPEMRAMFGIHDVTGGEVYDADYSGGMWMAPATETADTLDQFVAASESWAEVGQVREFRIAGLRAVYFGEVQARKGDKRYYLTVIDLGGFRVAIHMDCTEWAE